MLLIDAHEDLAYNALEWGRDPRLSAYTTREREAREHPEYATRDGAGGICMSGLPELRRGGFGIIFGTLFAYPLQPADLAAGCCQSQVYQTADEAYAVAQGQLAYYRALAREPGVSLLRTCADLERFLDVWTHSNEHDEQRPLGIVPLMEGADPIRSPEEVAEWFAAGLRIVGPAWSYDSRYAGGNAGSTPLSDEGRALLREMQRLGMVLDTTHLSNESFWQALESFSGPTIASHSNCRALVPSNRHLSDEMIRAIAARDGVIGIVPYNSFLVPGWSRESRFPVSLEALLHHIDHICQLTGSARHVGLGSDIDGGFGRDETPDELDTLADLAKLADPLRRAGYSEDAIVCILGGNWLRLLEGALPAS